MLRVVVRSRYGNVVLAAIGASYALASLLVLVWLVVDVWQAATASDYAVQIALAACAACGVWFIANAMENLGVFRHRQDARGSKPASFQR